MEQAALQLAARHRFGIDVAGLAVIDVGADDPELLSTLLNTAYTGETPIPAEVLVPTLPADADTLADVLSERRGGRVRLLAPQRGDKVRLVELAVENASSAA